MSSERNRTCPKCGGTEIHKEYYLGADTGDFKCADCGFTDLRHADVWYKKDATDLNELAARIVDEATSEEAGSAEPEDGGKNPHAVALGRLGGKKGGKARAEKLSPRQRSEIAKRAAQARWQRTR